MLGLSSVEDVVEKVVDVVEDLAEAVEQSAPAALALLAARGAVLPAVLSRSLGPVRCRWPGCRRGIRSRPRRERQRLDLAQRCAAAVADQPLPTLGPQRRARAAIDSYPISSMIVA
jgi:hypothetical protein